MFTVTIERASRHIADKKSRNSPHSGRFIVSSNIATYLENTSFCCKMMFLLAEQWKNSNKIRVLDACSYRFISWWWSMHSFSCFRICWNTCSVVWVCRSESRWPLLSPGIRSVMTWVCLIFNKVALSFAHWLQATHTSVA